MAPITILAMASNGRQLNAMQFNERPLNMIYDFSASLQCHKLKIRDDIILRLLNCDGVVIVRAIEAGEQSCLLDKFSHFEGDDDPIVQLIADPTRASGLLLLLLLPPEIGGFEFYLHCISIG